MDKQFFTIPKSDDKFDNKVQFINSFSKDLSTSENTENWRNTIFKHIFRFYNSNKEDLTLSKEDEIKESIKKWLRNDIEFDSSGLIVTLESKSEETSQEGYDDIRFSHSCWKKNYFVFECKCLDTQAISIKEYIYNPNKYKNKIKFEDGGVYRFITNKYASYKEFGGMIGFIQKGSIKDLINKIISELKTISLETEQKEAYGNLIELTEKSIENNDNTFDSKHIRYCKDAKRIIDPIKIHHIFFDFSAQ